MRLVYTLTERGGKEYKYDYNVGIIEVPSNLGKGKVLYFALNPVVIAGSYTVLMDPINGKAGKLITIGFITLTKWRVSDGG